VSAQRTEATVSTESRGSRKARRAQRDHHRSATEFILADTRLCEACGDCVEACRGGVLSVKGPRFHRHVRIDHPEECRGCGKCVSACTHGALLRIPG
jgi:NAD-dependent dihydropyrimidine dehydrogenase PreA subunit